MPSHLAPTNWQQVIRWEDTLIHVIMMIESITLRRFWQLRRWWRGVCSGYIRNRATKSYCCLCSSQVCFQIRWYDMGVHHTNPIVPLLNKRYVMLSVCRWWTRTWQPQSHESCACSTHITLHFWARTKMSWLCVPSWGYCSYGWMKYIEATDDVATDEYTYGYCSYRWMKCGRTTHSWQLAANGSWLSVPGARRVSHRHRGCRRAAHARRVTRAATD